MSQTGDVAEQHKGRTCPLEEAAELVRFGSRCTSYGRALAVPPVGCQLYELGSPPDAVTNDESTYPRPRPRPAEVAFLAPWTFLTTPTSLSSRSRLASISSSWALRASASSLRFRANARLTRLPVLVRIYVVPRCERRRGVNGPDAAGESVCAEVDASGTETSTLASSSAGNSHQGRVRGSICAYDLTGTHAAVSERACCPSGRPRRRRRRSSLRESVAEQAKLARQSRRVLALRELRRLTKKVPVTWTRHDLRLREVRL